MVRRSAKTAGYADGKVYFHGKSYFLPRNSASHHWAGSVFGCHLATANNIIRSQLQEVHSYSFLVATMQAHAIQLCILSALVSSNHHVCVRRLEKPQIRL